MKKNSKFNIILLTTLGALIAGTAILLVSVFKYDVMTVMIPAVIICAIIGFLNLKVARNNNE
jgi:hypothetical protein